MKDTPATLTALPRISAPPQLVAMGRQLRADAPLYLFIAAYACAVSLIGTAAGADNKVVPASLYWGVLGGLMWLLLLVLVVSAVMLNVRRWRSGVPAVYAAIPGALMVIALMVFMVVFSSMKQILPNVVPFYADQALARADAFLHGGIDPWRLSHAALPVMLVPALEKLYLAGWGAVKLTATLAALFLPSLRHVRRQYLWTTLLIWVLLGNAAAGAVMSGGPVFFERLTGEPRFAALTGFLDTHTSQVWVRNFLWAAYTSHGDGVTGQGISAFPSMHVASTTLCALLALKGGRWVGIAGVAFCGLILFGSVYLGWHYAIDGYVAILATIAVWKVVGAVERRIAR